MSWTYFFCCRTGKCRICLVITKATPIAERETHTNQKLCSLYHIINRICWLGYGMHVELCIYSAIWTSEADMAMVPIFKTQPNPSSVVIKSAYYLHNCIPQRLHHMNVPQLLQLSVKVNICIMTLASHCVQLSPPAESACCRDLTQPNPTQPDPWIDPIHDHVCSGLSLSADLYLCTVTIFVASKL